MVTENCDCVAELPAAAVSGNAVGFFTSVAHKLICRYTFFWVLGTYPKNFGEQEIDG
jgi:hypothetical protein